MTKYITPPLHTQEKSRILYLDLLRILAAFGVIMIHVSAQNWEAVDILSWDRRIYAIYNTAMSWPVAIFVMLSGVLFLDPDRPISIKKLYSKRIFRLITAFLFWSGIYALNDYLNGYNLWYVFDSFLYGHVHLWYLFFAAGYYIATPVFRQITQSKKITEYFLVITIIWLFLLPSLLSFLEYFQLPLTGLATRMLKYWKNAIPIGFTGIYMVYFVMGLYLHKYDLSGWLRKLIPFLAIAGYVLRLILSDRYIHATGSGNTPFDFAFLNLPVVVTVFLFGKCVLSKLQPSVVWIRRIRHLADHTFGIYMVHMLVMYQLQKLGLTTTAFSPIVSVPVITVAVMAVSYLISWILCRVPILKKYIM